MDGKKKEKKKGESLPAQQKNLSKSPRHIIHWHQGEILLFLIFHRRELFIIFSYFNDILIFIFIINQWPNVNNSRRKQKTYTLVML